MSDRPDYAALISALESSSILHHGDSGLTCVRCRAADALRDLRAEVERKIRCECCANPARYCGETHPYTPSPELRAARQRIAELETHNARFATVTEQLEVSLRNREERIAELEAGLREIEQVGCQRVSSDPYSPLYRGPDWFAERAVALLGPHRGRTEGGGNEASDAR